MPACEWMPLRCLPLVLMVGLSSVSLPAQEASRAAGRPNILLIYSDDHGWADLGAQGADADIRTPHLDQLCRDGVRFTRGYVSAPQCVPSRAGVITGRYQQRFGVEDNQHGPLPLEERTIAERLQSAGYVSGWIGKSHLDITGEKDAGKSARLQRDHLPHRQGFAEYFRGELNQYYASHDLQGRPLPDAPHVVTDRRFRVTVQTEAALSFLARRAAQPAQPWFLYLAWYAPHVPLESPEPWFSRTPERLPLHRRQALAMIAAMDEGLGRIRAALREMGEEQNTLIFFIGDNGAPLGTAWNGSLNLPLAGQKGMLAEGGIRTPFVAAWPGTWPAGSTYDHPVINLDVAATAVAAAQLPTDPQLDGVDLTPFVTGRTEGVPHKRLFWRWGAQAAVLEMPYKLIKLGPRPALLFDVSRPDGEHHARDLARQHPEMVERLERELTGWAAELQPPGLSTDQSAFSRRHEQLFAEHHLIEADAGTPSVPTRSAATEDPLQGWIARQATLSVRDGILWLTRDADAPKNARPFLTHSKLDLAGPVTVVLRVRGPGSEAEPAAISWRTRKASFAAHQVVRFDWPAGSGWQTVQIRLPEQARILHVRIQPPPSAREVAIQSVEFRDDDGAVRLFRFAAPQEPEK
ncbi:MAG: sulfatase-like hydrolase/transferase [Pirellulales bacterium]